MTPPNNSTAGLTLVFPVGQRPSVDDVIAVLTSGASAHFPCSVLKSADSPVGDLPAGLEVVVAGLAFELSGFAHDAPEALPAVRHVFKVSPAFHAAASNGVTLRPGPHLEGGAQLMPVVRAMVGLGATLTTLPHVLAIIWHPSGSAMGPADFAALAAGWLSGGAFPAIGLVALSPTADGGMVSDGLAFFTGQELRLEPKSGQDKSQLGKVAIRLIHELIDVGAILQPCDLTGPQGERLRAEPTPDGHTLSVWIRA